MSQRSRRPGREAIKEQRRARKKAQRALRQQQRAQGLSVPARPSLPNRKCPYQDQEEERSARLDAVSQQVKVYRAMLPVLLQRLSKIADPRNPRKLRHQLTVLMLYGILCFAFQMSSRREANRQMTRPVFEANLRQLFPDLAELPHQDTLARLLARIEVDQIEQAHLDMIRQLIRSKKFRRYLIGGCYPIAIDGTQKFTRAQCWDAACLERKVGSKKAQEPHSEPQKQYYVYVLEANLAFANGMVIPLLSEVLSDLEGESPKDKQDCEQRAFGRLAQRLKECFSHLPILLLLDGLYPNGPIIELCRQNNWDFMIVLQDDSLPTVWEEIEGLKKLEPPKRWSQNWGGPPAAFPVVQRPGLCLRRSDYPAAQETPTARRHLRGKLGGNRPAEHRPRAEDLPARVDLRRALAPGQCALALQPGRSSPLGHRVGPAGGETPRLPV